MAPRCAGAALRRAAGTAARACLWPPRPPDGRAGGACSIDTTIEAASTGGLELISLDGKQLTHTQLETLLANLRKAGDSNPVMAISLASNQLTDESCAALRDALRDSAFCPSVLTINLRGNAAITADGHAVLEELCALRPELQVRRAPRCDADHGAGRGVGAPVATCTRSWRLARGASPTGYIPSDVASGPQVSCRGGELGARDDVGLDAFRKGAVISEEEMPHARPSEQWQSLRECLNAVATGEPSTAGSGSLLSRQRTSRLSQVMREICDAVEHETCKQVREGGARPVPDTDAPHERTSPTVADAPRPSTCRKSLWGRSSRRRA